ncbi:MAG: helix-turn-helix domain-containing protein [Saccharofermentanales bacterium]
MVVLSKLFKEAVGVGFSEFLGNYRIEKSIAMLDAGNCKIKVVAILCGFNNYEYFIKYFKKKVGLTPKEYILELNKEL